MSATLTPPMAEPRSAKGDAAPVARTTSAPRERLLSLDVFRGLTVAGMLLVNDPGTWSSIYPPLEHSEWFGWTPTDLIFPFFLFIVGVAMTFSFDAQPERRMRDACDVAPREERESVEEKAEEKDQRAALEDLASDRPLVVAACSPRRATASGRRSPR